MAVLLTPIEHIYLNDIIAVYLAWADLFAASEAEPVEQE